MDPLNSRGTRCPGELPSPADFHLDVRPIHPFFPRYAPARHLALAYARSAMGNLEVLPVRQFQSVKNAKTRIIQAKKKLCALRERRTVMICLFCFSGLQPWKSIRGYFLGPFLKHLDYRVASTPDLTPNRQRLGCKGCQPGCVDLTFFFAGSECSAFFVEHAVLFLFAIRKPRSKLSFIRSLSDWVLGRTPQHHPGRVVNARTDQARTIEHLGACGSSACFRSS